MEKYGFINVSLWLSEHMKKQPEQYETLQVLITPELTPSKDGMIAQKTEEKIGKYDLNDFFLFYTLRYGF